MKLAATKLLYKASVVALKMQFDLLESLASLLWCGPIFC
jgi:hypothetical protein